MGEMVWAKSPQRFEHFVPDYCKEREGYVMIGLLLGISQHCTEKSKYRQQYPDSFQRQWSIISRTVQHGISAENWYELHRQKAQCACDYSQNHKSCQRLYKPQHSEKCTCFAAFFHAITSLRSQQGSSKGTHGQLVEKLIFLFDHLSNSIYHQGIAHQLQPLKHDVYYDIFSAFGTNFHQAFIKHIYFIPQFYDQLVFAN